MICLLNICIEGYAPENVLAYQNKNPVNASLTITWSPPNGPSNFIECKPIYYVRIFKIGWSFNQIVIKGRNLRYLMLAISNWTAWVLPNVSAKINSVLLFILISIGLYWTFYNLNFYTNYSVQIAAYVSGREFGPRMGAWSAITSQLTFSTCSYLNSSRSEDYISKTEKIWKSLHKVLWICPVVYPAPNPQNRMYPLKPGGTPVLIFPG